ncbi:MAG TPA: hypothetical protein VHM90_09555, partial [Phycisphaerae bacterium]|nr:hypothetical protein [Phycisphaerae bacterium]
NFLPLALSHDHANFRIFCYSATTRPDAMTQRLRALADEWRSTAGMPPDARADLIRHDQIDILVDLTMHMAYNNLLLLARKPAPIQVAMLCSMGTTGLPTVDYRISDRYSDPPAFNDAFYTEKTIRLPDCYFCHELPTDTPDVAPPPSRHTGHITYGSLNTFCKVNPHVLDLWARILLHTPRTRLLLRCPAGEPQSRVARTFAARGIAPERIEFSPPRLSLQDYLRLHHRMDIYLDPFPYASHTTGFDALWMGVPIITLAGTRDVGRAGVFLLSNVGLEDLIAQSPEEYLQKAAALAADPARLASLRETLRPRIRQSPLVDIARYTRHVEAAFRQMWHTWCQQKP